MGKEDDSRKLKQQAQQVFFALLNDALWRHQRPVPQQLSAKLLFDVLALSSQQAVAGLVAEALVRRKVQIPEDDYFEVLAVLSHVRSAGEHLNKQLSALVSLMDERAISYRVVKGAVVSACYPSPLLRQAGDIDFYCDAHNFPKAISAVTASWGVTPEQGDSRQHVHFEYNGLTIEGHFSLFAFHCRKKDRYWQQLLDSDSGTMVSVGDKAVSTLSPTLHVLYVFLHLYHHLMALGVGLRQFCDWALLLHSYADAIDHEALQQHLCQLGVQRAYRACGSLLIDRLGLPPAELYCQPTSGDRRYGRRVLSVVLYRGNMGVYHKQGGFSGWLHRLESATIKLAHFCKFAPLAPAFSCRWLMHEFSRTMFKR